MNRLQHETSPYLLQHKDNPVDWFPWGKEAFEKAQAENKPILLSVGYSACHWCHVMAHESFEDDDIAAMMNKWFVNVKVDREERPDVDSIYMEAVQAMTRQGGWPMTVFLTSDGRPFAGGTYFPKTPRMGMVSFPQLLERIHQVHTSDPDEIERVAENLKTALNRDIMGIGGDESSLNDDLLDTATQKFMQRFDKNYGGFSGAPKFPQPMNLEFLLRSYSRTEDREVLQAVTFTLKQMARGGIYDQIGGGFARYSVDAYWLVPHFEKMLYDNAQLSRVYLHAWQMTRDDFFKSVAEDIYDYVLREMTAPEGGFYSATDADSEGEEGKFFVWSYNELKDLLTEGEFNVAVEYWGVTKSGNFEGKNILYVPNEDDIAAERLDLTVEQLHEQLAAIKDKLYAARSHRVHPGLDDKILTAWNGMMLASLAEAARILQREDYYHAAVRAGEFLVENMVIDGDRLLRTHKEGQSKLNGYLEDYANLIDAMLELYQTTFDERWFVQARRLADAVLAHFTAEDGGFFDTSDDHETLIVRPRNMQDNAVPSGNSMIVKQLLLLAAYTGDDRYDAAARQTLTMLANVLREYPSAFGEALNAADALIRHIAEVAIVGEPTAETTQHLIRVLYEVYRPNLVLAVAADDMGEDVTIPLLAYRSQRGGEPTAYVCQNFACKMPVVKPDALRGLL